MANRNIHLASFSGVSASVGGYDISSFTEFSVSASANGVPQVTLLVEAGHSEAGGASYVDTVSLSEAKQLIETCRGLVKKDGATLTLSLSCDVSGEGSESLSLSGWLLTDVSVSSIQVGGVVTVAMTFRHPLCKADLGGAVPGLLGEPPDLSGVSGDNPLSVFLSALRAYADVYRMEGVRHNVPDATDTASVRSALLRHLEKAVSDIESALSWTGGGLPAGGVLGGWEQAEVAGLSNYALPGSGTSVLQTFLSRVVPECSLAVGGDYTASALEVGPFEPWKEPSLTIQDSDIVSLQFPGSDPSPLSGVKIVLLASGSDGFATYQPLACQYAKAGSPAEAFYVPDSELSAEYMYGPIHLYQEPSWLVGMASAEKRSGSADMSDTKTGNEGNLVTATSADIESSGGASFAPGGGSSASSVDYASAALLCAKAYYTTTLMKDWVFVINARFVIRASGGIICPGKVISVESGSGPVISGYILAVEHMVSVTGGAATTRIVCAYPRFGGSLPDGITSSKNPLYE